MAYLGEKYKRTLCRRRRGRRREGKDSESGHVMSYNQEVLQCTFTETLKEKDKNKNVKKKKKLLARPPDIPKLISFSTILSR